MKKIFAILFSFQLILSPVVLAQECKPGEDCYQVAGDGSSEGAARYTNNIMMTGSGVVGANLIFCTHSKGNIVPTFSHYIFMGGALVLLTSEIIAATKAKEAKEESQKQMERMGLVNSKPGEYQTQEQKDAQLTLLVEAKKQELDNRDALEERMNWMTAVEVVYWLALAGAVAEIIIYAATQVKPYGAAIGYNDQSIVCNTGANDKMLTAAISAAYGLVPGLIGGNAGGAAMKGISAGGFSFMLNSLTSSVGTTIKNAGTTALGRSITFGVFAALAEIARSGLKKSRDRANKNITLFDKSIEEWKKANTSTTEIKTDFAGGDLDGPDSNGSNAANIKQLPKAVKENKCMGSSGSSLDYSSKACSRPIKLAKTKFDFKSNYLNSMGGKAFDMADAMASGNTGAAKMLAADLASNAAKIKAEAKLAMKQANEKLKATGKKEIDFEKEIKNQLGAMSKAAQEAAAASGIKNLASGSDDASSDEKKNEPSAVGKVDTGASDAAPAASPDLTIGSSDLAAEEPAVAAGAGNPEQNLSDFETNEQDISKKNDVSLFKQLSNRYILNYTKIFERKKEPEVIQEPPKK